MKTSVALATISISTFLAVSGIGYCYNSSSSMALGPLTNILGAVVLGHVSNNATLAILPARLKRVRRDGFAVPGDGGAADYTLTATACSLNSGTGDGGSQIGLGKSGAWVGCAILDKATYFAASLRIWGAVDDDAADNQPALQAAIKAIATVGGGTLVVPATTSCFAFKSQVLLAANNVAIVGPGGQSCLDPSFAEGHGIVIGGQQAANYSNDTIKNIRFKHSVNRKFGADVEVYNTTFVLLENLSFGSPGASTYNDTSIGIDFNAVNTTIVNPQVMGEGNSGIRVGANSALGSKYVISAGVTVHGGNIQYQHIAALDLRHVSGMNIDGGLNTDFNVHGLYAHPSAGQEVGAVYTTNSFFDLSYAESVLFDDSAGGSVIENWLQPGTWIASSGATPNISATVANGGIPHNMGNYASNPIAPCLSIGGGIAAKASIAGTTLTTSGSVTGTIGINDVVIGTVVNPVVDGTRIIGGSAPKWTVNIPQTVSSQQMYFTETIDNMADVHSFACGADAILLKSGYNTQLRGVLSSYGNNGVGNGLTILNANHWTWNGRAGGTTGTNSEIKGSYGVAVGNSDFYQVEGDLTQNVNGGLGGNAATHKLVGEVLQSVPR